MKTIIVPDVHGRIFWEKIKGCVDEVDKIIFLGDYLDPYDFEGISKESSITNFKNIIDFAKSNDKTVLLIGNHDMHYYSLEYAEHIYRCRYDYENHELIHNIFAENKDMFKLCYELEDGKRYMFTHAGVSLEWIDRCNEYYKEANLGFKLEFNQDSINKILNNDELNIGLSMVSSFRGGYGDVGSCIWMDVREILYWAIHLDNSIYQIFGHTLSVPTLDKPLIYEDFAMLDARKLYILEDNNIKEF